MRLLALDQSTKKTGYSLFVDGKLEHHGVLIVEDDELDVFGRMVTMSTLISGILDECQPTFVCIEGIQYQNSMRVFGLLAQVQGIIFQMLFERNIGFVIIEPTAWRSYLGIKGRKRADQKAAAIQRVSEEFGLDVTDDEAEAILIGLWGRDNLKEKGNNDG